MAKRKKKENKKEDKEKIDEIFKVEKKEKKDSEKPQKEKTIEIHKEIKEKSEEPSKKDIKKENKILQNVLLIIGGFILLFLIIYGFSYYTNHFEYKDMKWDIIREGQVTFYHTSFPILLEGEKTNYNVYIRNDPRKLTKIPFEGELNLREIMVINNTQNFICDGKGGAAMLNLQQILEIYGVDLMKDPNASCDSQGRYMFVRIQEGEETSVEQEGIACYNLNVKNCEIFKATEKIIMEMLVKYKLNT